ncbi:hypothetical protein [Deminuibacter soli]|uniref:Uncharacterized protein n=1 Tax=Deminuibacter soli TaxID=2291815 RepID=A0A3E1NCV0_9BACT|nr:hypothetical protein [Deminuibacter soli]RFM25816.1 hypothetical protein DXN05_22920 [Deminuibacter soli]
MITKAAITALNELLQLPATGNEQDWEVELADKNRIAGFVNVAHTANLSAAERFALVALILCSYEEFLWDDFDNGNVLWKTIAEVLNQHKGAYDERLNYWAVWNAKERADWFALTPLVRKYLKQG